MKIAALLFTAFLLGVIVAEATSPASTFYISGGVYPGAPSYTVWKEGSNYFAKNANGFIEYSGTNASQTINAILTSHYSVFIMHGTYVLDTKIVLNYGNIGISGEGNSTILSYSGTDTAIEIGDGSTDIRNWWIKNIGIVIGLGATGIRVNGDTYYGKLDEITIQATASSSIGIDFKATSNWEGYHQVYFPYISEALQGIRFSGAQAKTGIMIYGGVLKGRGSAIANGIGLNITNVNTLQVHGMGISAYETAVQVNTSYANFFNGLRMESVIYGSVLASDASQNRFFDCSIVTYTTAIVNDGAANRYKYWYGDKYTEIAANLSVTGAVNSFDIVHGLFLPPEVIHVTAEQSGQGDYWISVVDATKITLSFTNQPGGSAWWFLVYIAISE